MQALHGTRRDTQEQLVVDARLAVPECAAGFTLSHTGNLSGRVLLRAQCAEPVWATHMPADITLFANVIVAKKSLKRGAVLADGDVEQVETAISRIARRYLQEQSDVLGRELTRSVRAGTVLTTGMLTVPDVVKRGDAVTIVAGGKSVQVRAPGIAVTGGGLGKQINVRNASSNQVVRGWVRGPGVVEVPL